MADESSTEEELAGGGSAEEELAGGGSTEEGMADGCTDELGSEELPPVAASPQEKTAGPRSLLTKHFNPLH